MEQDPIYIKAKRKGIVTNKKSKYTQYNDSSFERLLCKTKTVILNNHQYVLLKQLLQDSIYLAYNMNNHSIDIITFNTEADGISIQQVTQNNDIIDLMIEESSKNLPEYATDEFLEDIKHSKHEGYNIFY